jgi:hypothetical protein
VLALIGKAAAALVGAGGGGALVAYGLFKTVGKKWLDQHFAVKLKELEHAHNEKLEDLKHAHNHETERLRHEINSLFSRVSKVHEKEFEVLPRAWFMLNEAHGVVMLALDLTMKYYPDFRRLSDEHFEEFLRAESRLSESQKSELRSKNLERRGDYFSDAMSGLYIDQAKEKLRLFRNYLIEFGIFMTEDIWARFDAAHKKFSKAVISYEVGRRGDSTMETEAQREMLDEAISDMIAEAGKAVQSRLHVHKA